jgi:hypothetical protein
MNKIIESEIKYFKTLGLEENQAIILACSRHNKLDLVQDIIKLEKENNDILLQETLNNLAPYSSYDILTIKCGDTPKTLNPTTSRIDIDEPKKIIVNNIDDQVYEQ